MSDQTLLTPEAARAKGGVGEELAALLEEVGRFVRNHPEVRITPPWKTTGGCLWEVNVSGTTAGYDDPEFMLSQLCERFGFRDD